ncbi:hypothetical protein [Streptomyces lavendulocolor]|uniref:hypothetical protein n=1 Tax=Streptomyces lavendulocolor TaxID=67316 RepID=UPI003C2E7492
MRHGHVRRWALAAAPVGALLLAGCGIQGTGVVEAGGPASVRVGPDPDFDALLFFRLPDGELTPVVRSFPPANAFPDEYERTGESPVLPRSPERAVLALLAGPAKEDEAAGLSTSLPRTTAGGVRVRSAADGRVLVNLPLALGALDATAVRQLICTAAYSKDRDGRVTVLVKGRDGVTATGICGLDLNGEDPGPTPTAVTTRGRTAPPGPTP